MRGISSFILICMNDTTSYTWIIPERATRPAIVGLLEALDKLGALVDADVRIMTVSKDRGVELPAGLPLPDGSTFAGGVITVENLPPQGILFQGTF